MKSVVRGSTVAGKFTQYKSFQSPLESIVILSSTNMQW